MSKSANLSAQALGYDLGWVFVAPWFVILAAGDLHRNFPPVPLLGYWAMFWPVLLVLSIIDGVATRARYYARAGH